MIPYEQLQTMLIQGNKIWNFVLHFIFMPYFKTFIFINVLYNLLEVFDVDKVKISETSEKREKCIL